MSRGNPLFGEWKLHPQVVSQLWQRYGRAVVDLFASRENAHCQLYFSLTEDDAPLGVDALAHLWPNVLLYAFPPLSLFSPTLTRVRDQGLSLIFDSPTVAVQTLDSGDSSVTIGPTLVPAAAQGPPVSGRGGDLPPPSRAGGSLGLARERLNLGTVGLPQNVIDTIQCARASSTRSYIQL